MKRVHMLDNRRSRAGLLKRGKNYPVPDDVARELIADGVAVDLEAPKPERAVAGPEENAARVTAPSLPFQPRDVTVADLASALDSVDDVATVHRLQKVDDRSTAAAHYERRVWELEGGDE